MNEAKGVLQKISIYTGIVSLLLAIACAVIYLVKFDSFGNNNPIAASLLASIFFFLCVSAVLIIIGKSNLPNLKVDKYKSENNQ